MADDEPSPLDFDTAIAMILAVERATSPRDLEIESLTTWRVYGECSKHGVITAISDTYGGPPEEDVLLCEPCKLSGVKRLLPIKDFEPVREKSS